MSSQDGSYRLNIEYQENNQDIDEEADFKRFCATIVSDLSTSNYTGNEDWNALAVTAAANVSRMTNGFAFYPTNQRTFAKTTPLNGDFVSDRSDYSDSNAAESTAHIRSNRFSLPLPSMYATDFVPIAPTSAKVQSSSNSGSPPPNSNFNSVMAKVPPFAACVDLEIKPINSHINQIQPVFMQTSRSVSSGVNDDDVRLSYAMHFINAFNGFDRTDMARKLNSWCIDDCFFTVKWLGKKGNPAGPNERQVRGSGPVTSFVEAIMVTACPDAVMQLLHSKLRIRPDQFSYLICKYSFKGTQIFKIQPVPDTMGSTWSGCSSAQPAQLAHSSANLYKSSLQNALVRTRQSHSERYENGGEKNGAENGGENGGESGGESKGGDVAGASPSVNEQRCYVSGENGIAHPAEFANKRIKTAFGATARANAIPLAEYSLGYGGDGGTGSGDDGGGGGGSRGSVGIVGGGGGSGDSGSGDSGSGDSGSVGGSTIARPFQADELLPRMVKMSLIGTMILHINPDKKITRFEFIQEVIHVKYSDMDSSI